MQHDWGKYFDTESDYWKKVQKIYEENDNYEKVVVSGRNLHHKFLRAFSRLERVEIDNDPDNLVSLSEGDHFLVHYYLWKCCITVHYKRIVSNAFKWMAKKSLKYVTDEAVEILAKSWTMSKNNPRFTSKGRIISEESRKKMSDSAKKRVKRLGEAKKVLCVETGEVFDSVRDAERKTGVDFQNISLVCLGKRKTAGRFHWKYLEVETES